MTEFSLIRDNWPQLLQEKGQKCFYSIACTTEFYNALLKDLFVAKANHFVINCNIDQNTQLPQELVTDLVEILTVIRALAKSYGLKEADLESYYYNKLKVEGGYDSHYIGFFTEADNPATAAEASSPKYAEMINTIEEAVDEVLKPVDDNTPADDAAVDLAETPTASKITKVKSKAKK